MSGVIFYLDFYQFDNEYYIYFSNLILQSAILKSICKNLLSYFSPQKREQLTLPSATISINLSQFLGAQHLRYELHNHDIIHLLVLLP